MEYKTNKQGNLEVTFKSNINLETTSTCQSLGEKTSEMEIFQEGSTAPTGIEWSVYDEDGECEFVEWIGLWFDGLELTEYDGVFELPKEAITLIRKSGFIVPEDFEL